MGTSVEEMLASIESRIGYMARRKQSMKSGLLNRYDLAQEGRIAAVRAYAKARDGVSPSYLLQAAEWGMNSYIKTHLAQKRVSPAGTLSLDRPVYGEEAGTDFHEVIAHDPAQTVSLEPRVSLKELLVETFGLQYAKGIAALDGRKEAARKIVRAAVEQYGNITPDRIAEDVDRDFFDRQGLGRFIWAFYNNSVTDAKVDAYPHLRPWQFKRVPKGYWSGAQGWNRAVEAVSYFCDHEKISSVADCAAVTRRDFVEAGLDGMLGAVFSDKTYLALKTKFPTFTPFKQRVQSRFLSPVQKTERILEFLTEKGVGNIGLQTMDELFEGQLRALSLTELRLRHSALVDEHGGSYNLLDSIFPNRLKPWLIGSRHDGWRSDPVGLSGEAARWLCQDYWGLEVEDIPANVSNLGLRNVGFGGMLAKNPFRGNLYRFFENAYPGRFSKRDFDKWRNRRNNEDSEIQLELLKDEAPASELLPGFEHFS